MLNLKHFCFGVLLLLQCSVFAQTQLTVFVADSSSKDPLWGATVTVNNTKEAYITNEKGIATISSLKQGRYVLHVYYLGYYHKDVLVNISNQKADTVEVTLCNEVLHLHETIITDKKNNSMLNSNWLNNTEIERTGNQNLAGLLNRINGVSSIESGGGISKPVIRGMHGQRIAIINGDVKLQAQQWGEDHAPEIGMSEVNEVSVIKGAATILYGTDAVSGAVKINKPDYLNYSGTSVQTTASYFSNNKQIANTIVLKQTHGKKQQLKYIFNGGFNIAGDEKSAAYNLSNTGFNGYNAGAMINYSVKNLSLDVSGSLYKSNQGILAGSHVGNINDLQRALQSDKPIIINPFTYEIKRPFMQVQHQQISAKLTYQINQKSNAVYEYAQQANNRLEFDSDRSLRNALINNAAVDLDVLTIQNNLTYTHEVNEHKRIKTGLQQQWQYNTARGTQYIIPEYHSLGLGTFAMVETKELRYELQYGVRFDYWSYNAHEARFYNLVNDYSRDFLNFSGVVSYKRFISDKTSLQGIISSGWRPPAINELYSFGLHYGIANFEIGNVNLLPEQSVNGEIVLKHHWKSLSISTSFFNQLYRNFIYRSALLTPTLTIRGAFPTFIFKQANVLQMGNETEVSLTGSKGNYHRLAFNILHVTNLETQQPINFIPANRVSLTNGFAKKFNKQLNHLFFEHTLLFVNRQNRYVASEDYLLPPSSYFLNQIALGSTLKIKRNAYNFSLNINNLFNTAYRDYLSRYRYFANNPGLNIIIKLSINFN